MDMSGGAEVQGLRMVFEGSPENLLQTITTVETAVGEMEQKVVASATSVEHAIDRSFDGAKSGANEYYDNLIKRDKKAAREIRNNLARVREERRESLSGSLRDATGLDAKFGAIGEKVESATGGIRKFQGAISGTVGVVVGIIGVLALWGNQIKQNRQDQEEFNRSLEGALDATRESLQTEVIAANSHDDLSKRLIAAKNEQLAKEREITEALDTNLEKRRAWFGLKALVTEPDTLGRNKELVEETSEALKKVANEYRQINALIRSQAREQEAAKAATLEAQAAAAAAAQRLDNIQDPAKKEDAIHQMRMDNIRERFGELEESNKDLYDEVERQEAIRHRNALKSIEDQAQAMREAIKLKEQADAEAEARAEEAHQKELARIEEQAQRIREENRKTLDAAAEGLQSSFGEETTRLLETIVKRVDRVSRSARRGG